MATTTTAPSSSKMQLFSTDDVSKHNTSVSCWVIHQGKVYDVTNFVQDHPGGDDLILRYAGKDMGDIMDDPQEHSHSDSAYELLQEHIIGRLPTTDAEKHTLDERNANGGFSGKNDSIVITDDFKPKETDFHSDYNTTKFLDLNKALIPQMLGAHFSKEFYLEQVHSPRHLKNPARFFDQDYLEMFTRTPWYVVPMVWAPIASIIFFRSTTQFASNLARTPLNATKWYEATSKPTQFDTSVWSLALTQTAVCWAIGVVIWTLLEYTIHRFLFHIDDILPERPIFLTLHFLLHGVHHYLPMDRLRLVMPPLLFFVLSYPFTQLAHALFPNAVANGIISGSFSMYVVYDCMHYALHHTKLPQYMKTMKQYHLEHHYKNFELGFGVTSKVWDYVFGTQL
ncbi:probable SCS7 - required for hydroxylation of ceramide [Melanopsichium pennsylvanicum]|uniref:Ceramide very long chain fatty acid hydroxylase n=2 Tax=Melanopsichium pennsylvanicum TaxID=63383 RepID=A0AAJ4XN97_9BASI|nr:probable SCS7-required for hydroxylation of ceramide [Melanopsichium pennsylvanicum 4]SNX85357.1 probable SCS7 - required for hydroxylation of ceramide [Melanopsichium pennsylvanicum]